MQKVDRAEKTCLTPRARLSFPSLLKPKKAYDPSKPDVYTADLIFDSKTDLTTAMRKSSPNTLLSIVETAVREKWGDKAPKNLKLPFKRGDDREKFKEGYEGKIYFTTTNTTRPQLLFSDKKTEIKNEADLYAGCFVHAIVSAHAYDVAGNKGVTLYLNTIIKAGDGDALGGGRIDTDAYLEDANIEDDAEDASNYGKGATSGGDGLDLGF